MALDTSGLLAQVNTEIARLEKLRSALLEAGGSAPRRKISETGSTVLKLNARLRWARKRGDKPLVRQLEKQVADARNELKADKERTKG
jgi:outer membrane murein-binding lipoprotein Lpp